MPIILVPIACITRSRAPGRCRDLEKTQQVLLTHGDSVTRVADNFKVVGRSGNLVAAIANDKLRLYGVQFHPEVRVRPG